MLLILQFESPLHLLAAKYPQEIYTTNETFEEVIVIGNDIVRELDVEPCTGKH